MYYIQLSRFAIFTKSIFFIIHSIKIIWYVRNSGIDYFFNTIIVSFFYLNNFT